MITVRQIHQVIDRSREGRQNASKCAARVDALAAIEPSNRACLESTEITWHRWFGDPARMPVITCDASPMNPRRKLLTLACRHEVWSLRKAKYAACPTCAAARTKDPTHG